MRGYRYGVSENTTAGSPYPMAPEKPCSGDAAVRGARIPVCLPELIGLLDLAGDREDLE